MPEPRESIPKRKGLRRRRGLASTALAAAISYLLARVFGWDAEIQGALTVVIGAGLHELQDRFG